jgi:hypothetical protein
VGAITVSAAPSVGALEAKVSSRTATQIYEVQGGEPGLFLLRRRFSERLNLSLSHLLPGEEEAGYRGPRLTAHTMLRLDTDVGFFEREITPDSPNHYVPGYDPYALDLMVAELKLRDLLWQTTDLRVGRLLGFDAGGFFAFDGAHVVVRLPWHVKVWVAAGAEVVTGQRLSSGSFEVDGVLRQRRDQLDEDAHTEFEHPPTRALIAVGASLHEWDWLTVDLAYREGVVTSGKVRSSYRFLAGSASVAWGPLRGGLRVAGELASQRLTELSADFEIRPWRSLRLRLEGRYDAPFFDVDSIFAAFWADPALEGLLTATLRLWEGLHLGLSGLYRQLGFLAPDGQAFDSEGSRQGGELFGRWQWHWLAAQVRGRFEQGYGGQRLGATARLFARAPVRPFSADLRGTVLRHTEDLAPYQEVLTYGYVVGAHYRVRQNLAVTVELEHNANRLVGQQFRFVAFIDLGFGQ